MHALFAARLVPWPVLMAPNIAVQVIMAAFDLCAVFDAVIPPCLAAFQMERKLPAGLNTHFILVREHHVVVIAV